MRRVRLVVLLLACMLAAGCTKVVEGTPSAPSGVLLPPRPREVRLDGVDPCSLLTPAQRAGLGLDGKPQFTKPREDLFRGEVPTCTITGFTKRPVALGVGIVTTVGIELWQHGDLAAEVQPTSASGFPAVFAVPTRHDNYCSVEVDVARGQLLDVQLSDAGGLPPVAQADLCAGAVRAASELVGTLVGR